ncbi:Aldose 1-epimerase [Alkalibacterium sp. AK22]|uniref:aldose epimerase family protein n=1 Tax=Alkalibacterium sp. AK22 TaxID=1229520 RepID=UPI00044D0F38|nr:aldose epimerase family protein [Alkalibacterium sp. AK22]EXJ23585.1 Aldose 1-epimerase [Alkalibacterium sp. AK22]
MKISSDFYGKYENKDIKEYTLTNTQGVSISAIPFGAVLTKIVTPDKRGNRAAITLNVDNIEDMINYRPFYGAVIGRTAGRIAQGKFQLSGRTVHVDTNEGGNQLHGGPQGLDTQLWAIETEVEADGSAGRLIFRYNSPAGENGFPGNMEIKVTYTLTETNDWIIDYSASTDARTPFNPTHHVYFNLTGDVSQSVLNHELKLNSQQFAPLTQDNLPTGKLENTEGTPFDFSEAKSVGEAVLSAHPQIKPLNGLDHPFVIKKNGKNKVDGSLYDPMSGREVQFQTDRDSVVIFTHNEAINDFSIEGRPVRQYAGITLETQQLPDALNQPGFGNIVLEPGETYQSRTIYSFGLR